MKKILLLFIVLCCSVQIKSQENSPEYLKQKLRFSHLTVDDGLSQGLISSITQDHDGFMWFGTGDGLNRFDGYGFKVFRFNSFETTSLPDNFVKRLHTDKTGKIWVGTVQGGLSCFSSAKEIFYRFPSSRNKQNSIIGEFIYSIIEDTTSKYPTFWIATNSRILNQIVLYPNSSDSLSTPFPENAKWIAESYRVFYYSLLPEDSLKELSPEEIKEKHTQGNGETSLIIDKQKKLWIGLANREVINTQLKMIQGKSRPDKKTFHYFMMEFPYTSSDLDDKVFLFNAKNGVVWAGTNTGISQMTDSSAQLINYKKYTYKWNDVNNRTFQEEKLSLNIELVDKIAEDQSGKLWISTRAALFSFSPSDKIISVYRSDPRDPNSPLSNYFSSVFVDNGNIVWCGTNGYGLSYTNPYGNAFHHYFNPDKPNLSIYTIEESGQNKFWLQMPSRIDWLYFDRKTGRIIDPPFNLAGYEVMRLIEDHNGSLWFISKQKLYVIDRGYKHKAKFIYSFPDREPTNVFVYEDDSQNIWVADPNELIKINSQTKTIERKFPLTNLLSEDDLIKCLVRRIYHDGDVIWLISNTGLFRVDLITGTAKIYKSNSDNNKGLNTNDILTFHPDPLLPNKFLWLGTRGGGLNKFNIQTEEVTHYSKEDGLPNNVIYGLLSDDKNNLWMSTNSGISRMQLVLDTLINGEISSKIIKFTNYDKSEGLQGNEFNRRAYLKTKSGELVFGGLHGFNIFNPDEIIKNNHKPKTAITGLQINYKEVTYNSPGSILTSPISKIKSLTLPYEKNTLTFNFASFDFSSVHKNQFTYFLEGYDENWSTPRTNRTATYTGLPPGKYILYVKGSNNNGVWDAQGTSLAITITPPFWRTWWAYIFYVFVFLFIVVVIFRSERNRQQLKYNAYQNNLEAEKFKEVNRVKSNFFANISHELRTPLTLIMGMVDKTFNNEISEAKKYDLNIALSYSKKLLKLINELLLLSKIDAGQEEFNPKPGNIVPLVKNITTSFQSLAEMKNIKFSFSTAAEKITVEYERDKIEKIMNNLLSNAFKFTKEGGKVAVKLETSSVEHDDNSELKIVVSDTGIGIQKEKLPHIFDRFYQVDSSLNQDGEGTGIGLSLTSELVQLHKGGISVESNEGAGTTFIVTLPISSKAVNADEIEETEYESFKEIKSIESKENESLRSTEGKYDILVIDDNPDLRYYIKDSLLSDYNVYEAEDGKEGLKLAEHKIPDLIITDVMMPKLDGYELTSLIRKNKLTSHIPIIMLTARAGEEDKYQGLESGVDAFLTKPFSTKELAIRVNKLIELMQLRQQKNKQKAVTQPAEVKVTSLDQQFLQNLHKEVEKNIGNESYNIEQLATSLFISSSQLRRKLKALIGLSPVQYIRSMRMNRAKELLEKGAGNVTEITFEVGYSNVTAFSKAFKEEFGITPSSVNSK